MDSREPLGESFSPGSIAPWKPRKSRGARAVGLSIITTIEFGSQLFIGARKTRTNIGAVGRSTLNAVGGYMAIPEACRDQSAKRRHEQSATETSEEVMQPWYSEPLAH